MLETMADGLDRPWSFAFLPEGVILVTEKAGALRTIGRDRKLSEPIAGLPEIAAVGQGGLLDIALHPGFRADPAGLPVLRGTARGGQERHQRDARQALGGSSEHHGRQGHLPPAAGDHGRPAFRLAHRLRPHRRAVRHHGRPRQPSRRSCRSPTITSARSSASPRMAAFRPTTRRSRAGCPRSGPSVTAMCRAPRSIRRRASSGRWNTAPRAATS